jgi:MFS family permease
MVYGIATSTGMVAYQSTLRQQVPGRLRGRVFAFYNVLWNGARLVSIGVGGALADLIGVQSVYLAGGLLLVIAFAVGWIGPVPGGARVGLTAYSSGDNLVAQGTACLGQTPDLKSNLEEDEFSANLRHSRKVD